MRRQRWPGAHLNGQNDVVHQGEGPVQVILLLRCRRSPGLCRRWRLRGRLRRPRRAGSLQQQLRLACSLVRHGGRAAPGTAHGAGRCGPHGLTCACRPPRHQQCCACAGQLLPWCHSTKTASGHGSQGRSAGSRGSARNLARHQVAHLAQRGERLGGCGSPLQAAQGRGPTQGRPGHVRAVVQPAPPAAQPAACSDLPILSQQAALAAANSGCPSDEDQAF